MEVKKIRMFIEYMLDKLKKSPLSQGYKQHYIVPDTVNEFFDGVVYVLTVERLKTNERSCRTMSKWFAGVKRLV